MGDTFFGSKARFTPFLAAFYCGLCFAILITTQQDITRAGIQETVAIEIVNAIAPPFVVSIVSILEWLSFFAAIWYTFANLADQWYEHKLWPFFGFVAGFSVLVVPSDYYYMILLGLGLLWLCRIKFCDLD